MTLPPTIMEVEQGYSTSPAFTALGHRMAHDCAKRIRKRTKLTASSLSSLELRPFVGGDLSSFFFSGLLKGSISHLYHFCLNLRLFQHTFGTHPEQPLPTGYFSGFLS